MYRFGNKTVSFASILLSAACCSSAFAQVIQSSTPRISAAVDETRLVTLSGNTPRVAQGKFDLGPVPDSTSGRMLLVLKRSAEQETELQQLLQDQQTSGSKSFHKWLTPAEFGSRFGVADADVQTVTGYLASQGFQVGRIFQGKGVIEVTGTAAQIRKSFHTEMHTYAINGKQFVANQSDPKIPAALAPVVTGFAALNNHRSPSAQVATRGTIDASTGRVKPLYDGTPINGNPSYAISPGDLKAIYDVPAPTGATPAKIGVISDSNVNLDFLANYTSLFATGASTPAVVVDGNDPGVGDDSLTTLEELEIISGINPAASLTLYTSATTDYDTGLNFAIIRAVDDDAVNVLEIGASECEANLGVSGNLFLSSLWEQASAEGISVIAATGDSGSAGCDLPGSTSGTEVATQGLAVNGYASTVFDTAIGGTDFYYGQTGTSLITVAGYWNAINTGFISAKTPNTLVEQAWNDSKQTYDQATSAATSLVGSGGGPSTAGVAADGVTVAPWTRPTWQAVASAVSSSGRVIPDLSFFAGDGANYSSYLLCTQASDCATSSPTFTMAGGTAAAAAVFSGIAGLLIQQDGAQGNLNPELYALSGTKPANVFRDVTNGSNSMACSAGSGCIGGFMSGFATLTGYDAATGLGSLDAKNFITKWSSASSRSNVLSLSMAVTMNGQPVTGSIVHGSLVKIAVTATGTTVGGAPTGDVAIASTNPYAANKGIEMLTLAPTGTASNSYVDDSSMSDDYLPGGSYNLVANYPGGLSYQPAQSNSVAMNITPEPSQVLIISSSLSGSALSGFNPGTFSNASFYYGQPFSITVEPFSLNQNEVGIPSGSVQVYDQGGSSLIASVAINSEGTATFVLNQLAIGGHSLVFQYSGDSSFKASSSIQNSNGGGIVSPMTGSPAQTAVSFVIQKDVAMTTLTSSSNTVSLTNPSVILTAVVQASTLPNTGRAPSGQVQFNGAGPNQTNLIATLIPSYDSNGNAIATASILITPTLSATGSITINATYLPDTPSVYSAGAGSNPVSIAEYVFNTDTVTTIIAAGGGTSFVNTSPLVFNITASGILPSGPATGTVTILANGIPVGSPVTLSGGLATFTVPMLNNYLQLPSGNVIITAQYNGGSVVVGTCPFCVTYPALASVGAETIKITGSTTNPTLSGDFSIEALNTARPVSATNTSTTYGLLLTSLNNFAANYGATTTVNLSCTAPSGVACSFTSGPPVTTLATNLATGLTPVTLYVTTASGSTFASIPKTHDRPWWPEAGGATLACVLLCGIPGKRRKAQAFFMVLMLALVSAGIGGCGGSGLSAAASQDAGKTSAFGNSGSANVVVSTGTYPITVTATTTTTYAIMHSVTVNLVVQ